MQINRYWWSDRSRKGVMSMGVGTQPVVIASKIAPAIIASSGCGNSFPCVGVTINLSSCKNIQIHGCKSKPEVVIRTTSSECSRLWLQLNWVVYLNCNSLKNVSATAMCNGCGYDFGCSLNFGCDYNRLHPWHPCSWLCFLNELCRTLVFVTLPNLSALLSFGTLLLSLETLSKFDHNA